MVKEQLLQALADAYEQLITVALQAWQRGEASGASNWGAREVIAHVAGWTVIAGVRLPAIVVGMSPVACVDEAQQALMDDAINAALVTMVGDQSLTTICGLLRRASQGTLQFLQTLDDRYFQPGADVYRYVQEDIDHCMEHRASLLLTQVGPDAGRSAAGETA
jgi:hypothetical protein